MVWYVVYGIWYMVYGIWYMVYGIWYMVYGMWYVVCGMWYVVCGMWYVVCGMWYMVWQGRVGLGRVVVARFLVFLFMFSRRILFERGHCWKRALQKQGAPLL